MPIINNLCQKFPFQLLSFQYSFYRSYENKIIALLAEGKRKYLMSTITELSLLYDKLKLNSS